MARHPWVKKGTKLTFKDGTVGYPSNYSAWHSPKDFIDHPKHTPKKKTNESYKIHYPSLKKLSELEYVDPRVNTDGKRICVEKEGNFRKGDRNIAGHYVVYEDSGFPGSYIGVHIGNELSEDDGQIPINVVAIDPSRSAVINRVAYRARQSKIAESEAILTNESREISLIENMREVLDESKRPVRFRELVVGDKFRFADDDEILVKVSATHYKCNGVKYGMPNKSELVIKESYHNGGKNLNSTEIKKIFGGRKSLQYGSTNVTLQGLKLKVEHHGNMGASIKDVDNSLKNMGLPPIKELKTTFKVEKESGHPDYIYVLIVNMMNKEESLDEKKAKNRTSGPKRTDTKYGSPSDRGSADRYYGRQFDPHFYERGSYSSKRHDIKDPSSINVQGDKRQKRRINRGLKLTKKQYGSYKDSFENQEDRKDYGE